MTASSIEFFPCQVQLMGVQNRGDVARGVVVPPPPPPARPPADTVKRISRNLFGAPEPGEIAERLREENQRQRSYVLQRYNFDIKTSRLLTNNSNNVPVEKIAPVGEIISTPLPDLILKEMEEYEQRLQGDMCNLSRTDVEDLENTTSLQGVRRHKTTPIKRTADLHNNNKHLLENCVATAGNERLKPYARQTLLTECFNLRKSAPQLNGKTQYIVANNRLSPQRRVELIQLPKPIRAAEGNAAASYIVTSDNAPTTTTTAITTATIKTLTPGASDMENSALIEILKQDETSSSSSSL